MQQSLTKNRSNWSWHLISIIFIVVLIYTVFSFLLVRFEPGDGAIFYPVVQNTAHGAFMQWNIGRELATGVSSIFYVLFLVPIYWLSPNPEVFVFFVKVVNYLLLILLIGLITGFLIWFYKSRNWGISLSILLLGLQLNLVFSAMGGFENGLYFCIITASFWVNFYLIEKIKSKKEFKFFLLLAAAITSLISLTRIEGLMFVFPILLMVFFALQKSKNKDWIVIYLCYMIIVFFPITIWSLYAIIKTGYLLPTSGLVRRNQLLSQNPGIYFSLKWIWNYIPYLILILIGSILTFFQHRDNFKRVWLSITGLFLLFFWFIYFTFVFPIDLGNILQANRHLLIIPFFSAFFLPNIVEWLKFISKRKAAFIIPILGISFIPWIQINIVQSPFLYAWNAYRDPVPYMNMMQPELSNWINKNTPPNSTILQFEIEAHYLMNRRMIDMEGYMGGLALPYMRLEGGGDFSEFLIKYRPDYWVVDKSIITMPFFKSTIYERALKNCLLDSRQLLIMGPLGCTYEENGIKFVLIKIPPSDQIITRHLWEYRGVMKLDYAKAISR